MPSHLLQDTRAFSTDFEQCRSITRAGSKSFYAASLMLPKQTRMAAYAVYAFCRVADDLVDLSGFPQQAIAELKNRLDRAYAGRPIDDPVDRAFAYTVAAWDLPKTLPLALLEGFEWDAEGRRYETLQDLQAYAARVAGTVGGMMTTLMGSTSPNAAARACDLGVAMQLTNIARDIGEDARAGRIYAPLSWMRDAGLDPEMFLERPVFDERIASVTDRLLNAADPLYERGLSGVSLLPGNCQTAITAAGLIYRDIGQRIRENDLDSVQHRAFVPKTRKLALLAKASAGHAKDASKSAALVETQFLVDALTSSGVGSSDRALAPTRVLWVLDLFMRLERQERAAQAS